MKKLFTFIAFLCSLTVLFAQPRPHHGFHGGPRPAPRVAPARPLPPPPMHRPAPRHLFHYDRRSWHHEDWMCAGINVMLDIAALATLASGVQTEPRVVYIQPQPQTLVTTDGIITRVISRETTEPTIVTTIPPSPEPKKDEWPNEVCIKPDGTVIIKK